MAILRITTGKHGQSHCEDIEPKCEPLRDVSEQMMLPEFGGIIIRRFDPKRSNDWHPAPGRVCVYAVSGAVDIEIGDWLRAPPRSWRRAAAVDFCAAAGWRH